MVKALPFIHQPDQLMQKASDMSAADWQYQTHMKKYSIFSRVLLGLFLGLEIFVYHHSLCDKNLSATLGKLLRCLFADVLSSS